MRLSKTVVLIVSIVLFPIVVWLVYGVSDNYLYTRQVHDDTPLLFPVLVIFSTQDTKMQQAKIIFYRDLDEEVKTMESYTFLVPADSHKKINATLAQRSYGSGDSGPGSFKIIKREDGKQYLEVKRKWGNVDVPHTQTGWYIADDKAFKPLKYHSQFEPGHVIAAIVLTISLYIVFFLLAVVITIIKRAYINNRQ